MRKKNNNNTPPPQNGKETGNGRNYLVDGTLPWDDLPGERRLQNIILILFALLCLLAILFVELTEVPEAPDRPEDVDDRFARLVEEPPPPPEPEEDDEPEEEEDPEEEEPEEIEEPDPEEAEEAARERAQEELSVFEDSLAGLRDREREPRERELREGGAEAEEEETTRDLLTARGSGRSGGLGDVGGGVSTGTGEREELEEEDVAAVDSEISDEAEAHDVEEGPDGERQRSRNQIRQTFDRYAGRINSIYQRALRANPALEGTVRLSLEIDPSGEVTSVEIVSSELDDDDVERRLITIVRGMDFGEMDVATWEGEYPVNFFPN